MEHETRRRDRSEDLGRNFIIQDLKNRVHHARRSADSQLVPDDSRSMFGPARVMPPPPPPPNVLRSANENNNRRYSYDHMVLSRQPRDQRRIRPRDHQHSSVDDVRIQALAESSVERRKSERSREMMNLIASNAQHVQEKTQKGLKKAQKGIQKGLKKGREGLEDVANKALPVVKTTIRQLSSQSSSSFETISSGERNIQVLDARPVDFHPAFMHGDKLCSVPGIHPPSYEDALRDPTEPPTYAQPPPLPPSPNQTYDVGGCQLYDIGGDYPTLPKYSTLPRDDPVASKDIYDNHALGASLYDQAGLPSRPPLPPRNSAYNLPRESESISPESSVLNQEIVRVTSSMNSIEESSHKSDKSGTKSDKSGTKNETSKIKVSNEPKKDKNGLKRLISDPVTLKNPFNPTASDGNIYNMPTRAIQDAQKDPNVPKQNPVPKTRTRLQPTPPPRTSLMQSSEEKIESESLKIQQKPVAMECELTSGYRLQQVKIVEKDKMDEIKEAIYKIEEDLDSDNSDDFERETKNLKERTKHSLRLMKNEFMKKVQFPYLVRALTKYKSANEGHLNFKCDDHIVVSDYVGVSKQDGQKWFIGEHSDSGEIGIFPEDLVIRIDGDSLTDSTIWV